MDTNFPGRHCGETGSGLPFTRFATIQSKGRQSYIREQEGSRIPANYVFFIIQRAPEAGGFAHATANLADLTWEDLELKLFGGATLKNAGGFAPERVNAAECGTGNLRILVVVLDGAGRIASSSAEWHKFVSSFAATAPFLPGGAEAENFVSFLGSIMNGLTPESESILAGVQGVIDGVREEFEGRFSLQRGRHGSLYRLLITALPEGSGATVTLCEIISRLCGVEQELLEKSALFQRVIEDSRDGIFLYDLEGRFVMTNSANSEMLGYGLGEMIGKSVDEVFPAEMAGVIRDHNLLVFTTGQSLEFELALDTPYGRRTVLVQKGIYRNHAGEVVGIFGIARDITARKKTDEALERSERHFRALIENSADCIALIEESGCIRYVSPSTSRITGFEFQELVGTNLFLWVHPEDLAATRELFRSVLELPGASMDGEFRSLCKGGQWRWMEATATNLLHDPSVGAVVLNGRDISERKSAAAELVRLAAIVESSNDAIIGMDLESNITSWNPAAQRIFGYRPGEILGGTITRLLLSDREPAYRELTKGVLNGKGVANTETVCLGRDGHRIDVSITLSPIRVREKDVVGISAIIRDTTDRRRLEREILEISDHERQRLGHDLHDDLCQILVGISLQGNLLKEELRRLGLKQSDDAQQLTELAKSAVDHARSLAKGLAPFNLADGGFMVGLEALIADTERIFRVPCVFECESPVFMKSADVANHLYRITQEALHNAVKHSEASKVVVSLQPLAEFIVITVRDNGIGITKTAPSSPKPQSCRSGGHGIHIMQYRARIIGANLEFLRNPEGGTSVVCSLPNRKKP